VSDNGSTTPVSASLSEIRSLPPQPSLEFERKQAKALLRQLRAGEADALHRARSRHATFRLCAPERVTLADAQLIVAREYGFTSWPRLSRYITTIEREAGANRSLSLGQSGDRYEQQVQRTLAMHAHGWGWVGRAFAAYVPRLYGQSIASVLAATVTIEDARQVVARERHCSSWEHLLSHANAELPQMQVDPWERESAPDRRAVRAIRDHDLSALQGIVREHPDVLLPSANQARTGWSLIAAAVEMEPRDGRPNARAITDWLASYGFDVQLTLNRALFLDRHPWTVADVRWLLERGADPLWLPPSGISALDHAIVSYWNGNAVDVLAQRVTPRNALWIAAGLGDVTGVRRFFDRRGKLTPAAYRDRPPLELMSVGSAVATLPDPDDVEVLAEAAMVAAMNGRTDVLDVLIDMGYPVDHRFWCDMPMTNFAIQHDMDTIMELLIQRGCDLDLKVQGQQPTAREFVEMMMSNSAPGPTARTRRIAQMCGVVIPAIDNAENDQAQRTEYGVELAIGLASEDAVRSGATAIDDEHLCVALIRMSQEFGLMLLANGHVDLLRLREHLGDRVRAFEMSASTEALPLSERAQSAIARARVIASGHGHAVLSYSHLFTALLEDDSGDAAQLFVSVGGSLPRLRAEFARVQEYGLRRQE
jgi:Clp amino terminal domain, pathogenicity island component